MKFLIATVFVFVSAWPALGGQFTLFYESGTFNVGDPLTLGLEFSGLNPGPPASFDTIFAYQTDLFFNPSQLNFVDADEEGFFLANGIGASLDATDNVNGTVTGISDYVAGPDGLDFEDRVLNLNFLVVGAGLGYVGLVNASAADNNFNSVPVSPTAPFLVETQDAPAASPEPATFFSTVLALAAGFFLRKRIARTRS